MATSFMVLRLVDLVANFAYTEGLTDAEYLDRPHHTAIYNQVFDKLRVAALGERETAQLLERRIEELM